MAWWDGDEIDYDSDWYQGNENDALIPQETPQDNTDYFGGINTGGGNTEYNPGTSDYNVPEENNYFGGIDTSGVQTGTGPTWNAPNAGSIQNTLAGIFSGAQNNPALMGKGLAAIMEGVQNKKKQSAMRANASQLDPWGSQRGFYQQQAQSTVTDPFSSPIVKAQVEQLQNAQNIKDAAAGRRSNSLTSSPAVMAEMAKIAQQYQAQMAQQGGANINPSGLSTTLNAGSQADINGYISPLLTALGWNNQKTSNNVDPTRQAALDKFLAGSA